jgi:hypothetical protein
LIGVWVTYKDKRFYAKKNKKVEQLCKKEIAALHQASSKKDLLKHFVMKNALKVFFKGFLRK